MAAWQEIFVCHHFRAIQCKEEVRKGLWEGHGQRLRAKSLDLFRRSVGFTLMLLGICLGPIRCERAHGCDPFKESRCTMLGLGERSKEGSGQLLPW